MLHLHDPAFSMLLLFAVAFLAGIINGVAGGGGLILFPTLLFTGMLPIPANATNTASLWFGTAASTVAYRRELLSLRRELIMLTSTSILGGIVGAYVLLHTPQAQFTALIPYLMLSATLIFAFGKPLIQWFRKQDVLPSTYRLPLVVAMLLQFGIAIYIGFFGGGAGIVILAVLDLMGLKDVHAMNAVKTCLATCTNGIAVIAFMAAHAIVWPEAILMAIAALIGGYGSAHLARRLHPVWVRSFVICVGFGITTYFFCK
jgi:uncharacterized membrane protein YfcA